MELRQVLNDRIKEKIRMQGMRFNFFIGAFVSSVGWLLKWMSNETQKFYEISMILGVVVFLVSIVMCMFIWNKMDEMVYEIKI